jgi:hypothetical protein
MKTIWISLLMAFSFCMVFVFRPYFLIELEDRFPQPDSGLVHQRLNADAIKPLLFGFEGLLADLIWIYGIVEVDIVLTGDKNYSDFYTLTHLATDLDPYFEPICIYDASRLSFSRNIADAPYAAKDSLELLSKCWDFYINRTQDWEHYERYWMIPQMIGFSYYFDYDDKVKALPYFEYIAKNVDNAPSLYRTFAAEIQRQLDRKGENQNTLESIFAREVLAQQLRLNHGDKDLEEKIRTKLIKLGGIENKEMIEQEIQRLQANIQRLLKQWTEQYPYLTLNDFLMLHPEAYLDELASDIDFSTIMVQGEQI